MLEHIPVHAEDGELVTMPSTFTCLLNDSQAKEASEYQIFFFNELSFKLILDLILLLSVIHIVTTLSCYAAVGLFHYEIRLVPLSCLHTHPGTH